MDSFVEAADWIVWQLTGVRQPAIPAPPGYKEIWSKDAMDIPPEDVFCRIGSSGFAMWSGMKYACPEPSPLWGNGPEKLPKTAAGLDRAGKPGDGGQPWAMWTPMSASRP